MESSAGGMGIGQMLRAVRQRWWVVLLVTAIGVAVAWFFIPPSQTVYRATAVVRLDDGQRSLIGGVATPPVGNVRAPDFLMSQVHVITSRDLIGSVIDDHGLRLFPAPPLPAAVFHDVATDDPETAATLELSFTDDGYDVRSEAGARAHAAYGERVSIGGIHFGVAAAPAGVSGGQATVLPREFAIDIVLAGLEAVRRPDAAIFDIRYTAADPDRAVALANAVAHAYQADNLRGVQETARKQREFLEEQWLQAEERLAQAQQQLTSFRNRGQLYDPQERLRQEQTALLTMDAQRDQLVGERRLYESFLRRVENADEERIDAELMTLVSAPGLSAGPLLSQLSTQLMQYKTERDRLRAGGMADTHPEVERLTTLMGSIRSSVVDATRTQLASLDLRIRTLGEQRSQSASTVRSIPNVDSEDTRLAQEVSLATGTANTLRAEYHRARIAESIDLGQVEILDLAAVAIPQVRGNRTQKLIIAFVFALILGCATAVVLEASNKSVRWRGDVEQMLAVPGLGVIPHFRNEAGSAQRQRLFRRGANRNGTAQTKARSMAAAEAYRMLRTKVMFLQPDAQRGTLVVTSASSGEGKTTTAANLAASFAHQELHVLLVDCDLRRPRLHRVFQVEEAPGLVDLLLGHVDASRAIRGTPVSGLDFLPRGSWDERAPELLGGIRVRQLIEEFRQTYDIVLFDSPPVLSAADAATLASLVDGVLLVMRAGRTSRESARYAMEQLQDVGGNVIGFVLNDPDSIASRYGEYTYADTYDAVGA
ncbi:MAG TPA: polysaccharide biosynthesis tyrosine autokinase [Longimicrobiales bacterium]|nr:polysaccharide biosynthesis tyrosine autokinase [Longimicrobiales bacterium]